ncbi:MAG: DNA repair protein RadA, partial [Thermoflexibacteraceae bacterium]
EKAPAAMCRKAAEVGLGGEIRAINRIEQRISEAQKLGFKDICISKFNAKGLNKNEYSIRIHEFSSMGEIVAKLFL